MHPIKSIVKGAVQNHPMRAFLLKLIDALRIGTYAHRVKVGAVKRPHYGYCVYNAGVLAKNLGYNKVSVIEFGVAGGRGLLNLEYHARRTSATLGIQIAVYGFDSGVGLPPPTDYRDLPYCWKPGFFSMDAVRLKAQLTEAKLVLGEVRETTKTFFETNHAPPVAAVMFDLDYYSSTVAALQLFENAEECFLPRVFCYFDDITGTETESYCDYTGVRLAINEFNQQYRHMKLSPMYNLLCRQVTESWYHQLYLMHNFNHTRYNQFIASPSQQLPLT